MGLPSYLANHEKIISKNSRRKALVDTEKVEKIQNYVHYFANGFNYTFDDMVDEIKGDRPLTGNAINEFQSIVNKYMEKKTYRCRMQNVCSVMCPNFFVEADKNVCGLQMIPYDGHCVLAIYFANSKEIVILDSSFYPDRKATDLEKEVLERIWPGVKYTFVKPASLQPDDSCAIFAMEYVFQIIRGEDPTEEVIPLREGTGFLRCKVAQTLLDIKDGKDI